MTLTARRGRPAVWQAGDVQLTPHQSRYADAALALLAREGMASVTFRTLASETGRSLGAIQKAFPSKDVMVAAMFQRMRDTASAPALAEPGRPTLRSWLVDLTLSLLPLDAARRDAQLRANAFSERAAYDAAIGEAIAASDRELTANLALLVRRAVGEGEVPRTTDPDAVARAWFALAQGLASQLLYDPRPEDAVRADADFAISRLLGAS